MPNDSNLFSTSQGCFAIRGSAVWMVSKPWCEEDSLSVRPSCESLVQRPCCHIGHGVAHRKKLEAKGGAKASAPEWESGGQRGRKKHGALFGGRGEESFICGFLPGSSCERRERRETERRETERRERERERERERRERDERDEKEMREMRETMRQ